MKNHQEFDDIADPDWNPKVSHNRKLILRYKKDI